MENHDLLLAFHVRDLAMKRVVRKAEVDGVDVDALLANGGIEPFIEQLVTELKFISDLIKKSL